MSQLSGLAVIGETINDSVPSTHKLLEAEDWGGIQEVARFQAERGAVAIDVNVGPRSPATMETAVRKVQEVVSLPLSIDSPDPALIEAGLRAYDPARAGGRKPIVNSVSEMRLEVFALARRVPFRAVLLSTERREGAGGQPNRTGEEIHATALRLSEAARATGVFEPDDFIVDPGIHPIAADMEGRTRATIDALRRMHADPALAGTHRSVGLSNFTVMLPSKRASGAPVKGPLESAFLTIAMPLGLDMVIGSVKRSYKILSPGDDALVLLEAAIEVGGYEALEKVQAFCEG
ncbi:MAG: dihydropteroate synthase [Planctomycetes bacterium]|nr:dihydropteroate synthase [Planctomycetota bacterium]